MQNFPLGFCYSDFVKLEKELYFASTCVALTLLSRKSERLNPNVCGGKYGPVSVFLHLEHVCILYRIPSFEVLWFGISLNGK